MLRRVRVLALVFGACVALAALGGVAAAASRYPTALQSFVSAPDPVYSYTYIGQYRNFNSTTYWLNQTALQWLTPADTSQPVWWNLLELTVPDTINPAYTAWAVVYVDNGDLSDGLPTSPDAAGVVFSETLGVPYCWLRDIPNEPIAFKAEANGTHWRDEDAIIAYTWLHFFYHPTQPQWLLRFPMVKSVVRAMDTLQAYLPLVNHGLAPSKFLIAGASKRGWTTWLMPAVDARVQAIVPISMPIVNMLPALVKQYEAYGNWTFAFSDYIALNIPNFMYTKQFQLMAEQIDPLSYLPYLAKVPKMIVFGTADEFFIPDTPRNFMSIFEQGGTGGETHLRMAPNFDHPMLPLPFIIANNIMVFADLVFRNATRPSLQEELVYSNSTASIWVLPSQPPKAATLWKGTTIQGLRRDFRFVNCSGCFQPIFWYPYALSPNPDGSYSHYESAPPQGWTGFVIELSFASAIHGADFEITSQVNIVPDRFPFAGYVPPRNPFSPTPTP